MYKYLLLILILYLNCKAKVDLVNPEKKICLALSVGGPKGILHIAGINAIKKKNIKIDCVFGNSMGAVIGSLYAQSPKRNLLKNYRKLIKSYIAKTKEDTIKAAADTATLGMFLILLSGGSVGWESVGASAAMGTAAAQVINEFDNKRFQSVLDKHYQKYTKPKLFKKYNLKSKNYFKPIVKTPFATSSAKRGQNGIKITVTQKGQLSVAVSKSTRNPYIFQDVTIHDKGGLDPGLDRLSMTPIEETYETFKPDIIIALNVTGEKTYYTNNVKAKVYVINLNVPDLPSLLPAKGKAFDRINKRISNSVEKQLKTILNKP